MHPAKHITPPDWMSDPRCIVIMKILGGMEAAPQALFVGGCVRNTLLDKAVGDIDIATIHAPLDVIDKLTAHGIRHVPTGLEHGTVTAIYDDATFEITTLRKDVETDGRHAVIAFTDDWAEDAQRRDFTINTLLASPTGDIYDPTGQGLADLDARRVVFVGKPAERIAEDYLRILRFFRFHGYYGEGAPDADAVEACRAQAENLSRLSRERVTQECLKIVAMTDPSDVLQVMVSNDVLPCVKETFKAEKIRMLCAVQNRHDAPDVMARLFAVSGMAVNFLEEQLVLSNAQKRHLEMLAKGREIMGRRATRKKLRHLVYAVGNALAVQVYLLTLTEQEDLPDLELLDVARYWQAPEFPVKAAQLMEAGILQGPALGKKLKELEAKWIAKDFPAAFAFKK